MNIKNNYDDCLTNLACSIRKYFNLEYHHKTLKYIDDLLEKYNPKNVVLILYDGQGSRIIDRHLDENDFFIKNKYKEITTVFPTTTTAATTSIRTGLNPKEHGWLGWNVYIKFIYETITLFFNTIKENGNISDKFLEIKDNYLITKTITSEINKKGQNRAVELFPFGGNPYKNIDDMMLKIEEESKKEGKKFIYAYDDEPDYSMHDLGPDSEKLLNL